MLTKQHLALIFPETPAAKRDRFLPALNKYLPLYGITTAKRVCAFLATGGVETDYLRTTTEYASGAAYEGRKDLGNLYKGDGKKFRGRGFFQTTGRFNYFRVLVRFLKKITGKEYHLPEDYLKAMSESEKHGVNFLKYPEKLAEIEIAVESACIFWIENNLSKYADKSEFKKLSAVVNTGNPLSTPNHWAKRNELYSKCKRVIPADFSFPAALPPANRDAPAEPITPQAKPQDSPADAAQPIVQTSDSFLADALDRGVSSDEIKTTAKAHAPNFFRRLWQILMRPGMLLYAALEAGNIYAWLGVAVAVVAVLLTIYWHRAGIKKAFLKLKEKLTK